jgi:hypothetical protein
LFICIGVLSSSTCVTLGMSTSSSPTWKGVILDSTPKNEERSATLKCVLTTYVLGRSISYALSLILRSTLNGPSARRCSLL